MNEDSIIEIVCCLKNFMIKLISCRYWYCGTSENSWRLLRSFFETPRSHVRLQIHLYRLQIVFFSGDISEEQETGKIRSSFTQLHVILNLFDVLSVKHKIQHCILFNFSIKLY